MNRIGSRVDQSSDCLNPSELIRVRSDAATPATGAIGTGLQFQAGDPLIITATGLVNWTSPGGSFHGPDGQPGAFFTLAALAFGPQ